MKKLSIIILSYNVQDLLLACLASIPNKKDWEILVPDNGSTDGTVAAIRTSFPKAKVIENKKNLGFAAGNNVAIRQSEGQYVLLLNPDTVVYPNSIETVLDYMDKNPDVGAATCRVELADGSLDYSSHRGFPDPVGSLLHFIGLKKMSGYTNQNISTSIHQIDSLTGAFAMIRRTAGVQVNWLDEDYFWNGEDIDFCYKLKESGWKVVFIPSVKITHFKGASSKANRATRLAWAQNSTQVMELFYTKHLAHKYPFFVNWAVYFGIWLLRLKRKLFA